MTSDVREINGERYYVSDNGILYPSVTTILGIVRQPGLEEWRGRVGNAQAERILKQACDLGDYIHDTLFQVNTRGNSTVDRGHATGVDAGGDRPDTEEPSDDRSHGEGSSEEAWRDDEFACRVVDNYLRWKEANNVDVVYAERPLRSEQYRYAGTADAIARISDVYLIHDYKTTGSAHDDTWLMQLAAYRVAFEEEDHILSQGAVILQFDKSNGELTTHEFDASRLDEAFRAFLHALYLWRYIRGT